MRNPAEPRKPYKPYEPVAPKKYLPATHKHLAIKNYETSLQEILDATNGIEPSKVLFYADGHESYGDVEVDVRCSWEDPDAEPILNPQYKYLLKAYEKAVIEYKKALEKYEADMCSYPERLKKYQEEYKKYRIWFHSKELKILKKEQEN